MRWASMMFSIFAIVLSSIPAKAQQPTTNEFVASQVVWVNSADGEVKFSPGHKGQPQLGKDWIEAYAGQVMETGYTLATEQGRAEIEFENGSVVYLAENSVLEFQWLMVRGDKTETHLSLLTGTATVSHLVGQDLIWLYTPAATMRFTGTETASIESTLDGVVIHAVEGMVAPLIMATAFLQPGESVAYVQGHVIPLKASEQSPVSTEWDQWVKARLAERRALLQEGMREAGLKEPTPGLAGLVQSGKFFDCPPYGKCWQPNAITEPEAVRADAMETAQGGQTRSGTRQGGVVVNNTMLARCPMEAWRMTAAQQGNPAGSAVQYGTCFAGSWNSSQPNNDDPCLHRNRLDPLYNYWPQCWVYPTWVVGRRHHHNCHFVKTGKHGIGIVPRHPGDEKGKPLGNAKSGVLVLTAEKGKLQAGQEPAPNKGIQLVAKASTGIERGLLENAPRVSQPVIEGKFAATILPHGTVSAGHIENSKNLTAIRFDYKSGNFVGRSEAGGSSHAEVAAHVGSGGGAGGGGSHGFTGGGGSSGGGGGHSGGGSSGGGSSVSASSSSGGASAGGGGGHH